MISSYTCSAWAPFLGSPRPSLVTCVDTPKGFQGAHETELRRWMSLMTLKDIRLGHIAVPLNLASLSLRDPHHHDSGVPVFQVGKVSW